MIFAVALFALTIKPDGIVTSSVPDWDLPSLAAHEFAEGVRWRGDAALARKRFREAARLYDALWERGYHNPEVALNRARSHRLAGDLPRAIVALNEGLVAAPWRRPLQVELEDARSAVGYPLGDLAAQCRPSPPGGIGARMSPGEAWLLAGFLWVLACGSVARFAMTRRPGWLALAGAWLAALAILGSLWYRDYRAWQRADSLPLLVLSDDAVLRKGNSEAYPPRLDVRLPRGAEVRKIGERGGWVQVRLAGGAVGWLPANAVLSTGS